MIAQFIATFAILALCFVATHARTIAHVPNREIKNTYEQEFPCEWDDVYTMYDYNTSVHDFSCTSVGANGTASIYLETSIFGSGQWGIISAYPSYTCGSTTNSTECVYVRRTFLPSDYRTVLIQVYAYYNTNASVYIKIFPNNDNLDDAITEIQNYPCVWELAQIYVSGWYRLLCEDIPTSPYSPMINYNFEIKATNEGGFFSIHPSANLENRSLKETCTYDDPCVYYNSGITAGIIRDVAFIDIKNEKYGSKWTGTHANISFSITGDYSSASCLIASAITVLVFVIVLVLFRIAD